MIMESPRLSPTGRTSTEKFWVSPGGEIVPLRGLWHYQWALRNRAAHGVDLGDETEEQPIRLRMLAAGWWRMNFQRKGARLTIEGDRSGAAPAVRAAVEAFVRANARVVNDIRVNILDGEAVATSARLSLRGCEDEPEGRITSLLTGEGE